MAEMIAKGQNPDILFWVGCAGAYDDQQKKVSRALVQILREAGVSFAILGDEETFFGQFSNDGRVTFEARWVF